MPVRPRFRPRFRYRPLVAALAVAAAGGSGAASAAPEDPSPYYIGATQSLTHDSNVYRIPDNVVSGTYASTGLIGGFDQSIGRQHFHGAGNIRYNKYFSESGLDNTSYGVDAGWDWSTVYRLSGSLNLSAQQSLATNNGNSTVPSTSRNIVKTDQVSAGVRYGGYGRISIGADYAHSRVNYSAPEYFTSRSSGDSAGVNVYDNLSPDLTIGVGYRLTRTSSPYGIQVAPGVYDELTSDGRNVDLTVNYHTTAQTSLYGRLSYTRQGNSGASGQDFSGFTGAITASYMPTGKIGLSLTYARDAGTNGNFFNVASTPGTTVTTLGLYQSSQVTNSLSAGLTYAATAKIGVTAGLTYRHATIASTFTSSGVSTGSDYADNFRLASIGVNYAALRWLALGCNLSHESRNVGTTPSYTYVDTTVGCTATATIR